MKPHKHAELIKAWADGAEIEERYVGKGNLWVSFDGDWEDDDHWEYRIKPEPKPVEFVWDLYCRIYMKDNGNGTYEVIKAEPLKSAEVLK